MTAGAVLVDDSIGMARDVERHYARQEEAADDVRADIEYHVSEFVRGALKASEDAPAGVTNSGMHLLTGIYGKRGQYTVSDIMHESLDYEGGISFDAVLHMLAKVATGRAGQFEARDLINRMARESAYHFVDGTDSNDRCNERLLAVAGGVK
jgi:hypothetical protein